jgi:phospho-N-acetylmuramoyl-pentapeptide-transferase
MTDALLGACLAMLVTLAAGPVILGELRRRKLGKSADTDVAATLEAYAGKAGTPTMGGLMILTGALVAAVPFAVVEDSDLWLPLGAMLVAAVLGGVDDFQTLVGSQRISGHETWLWLLKWGALIIIGLVVVPVLYFRLDLESVLVPHFGAYRLDVAYLPVAVIVFVAATSGAVIADGMDGLMAGVSAIAYAAYGTIALAQGQDALGAFAFAVVGACAGFLWFNAYPARVFMGDLGAQALAVGLVVVAFMTGWWLLLPVIGVIFFAEGLSDVVQIAYFKLTRGHRILRMAPVHYHFQMGGWAETQVVTRFWLIALLGGFTGIALALID